MKKLMKSVFAAALAAALALPASTWAATAGTASDKLLAALDFSEVSTYAGTGELALVDGGNAGAGFRLPAGVAAKPDGTLLVADSQNQRIRSVSKTTTSTAAGIDIGVDEFGFLIGGLADGKADESAFNSPSGIAIDAGGTAYVADAGNHAIRTLAGGNVKTVAGTGLPGLKDGPGKEAQFHHPLDVAVTRAGVVYVADTLNHVIRAIENGSVKTITAASARVVEYFPGEVEEAGDYADGKLADAKFNEPSGLAIDAKGNLYVSDTGNHVIRYIDVKAGTVTTVAGAKPAYGGTELYAAGGYKDGAAAEARFNAPKGLAITPDGGLLIADSLNHAIRYLKDGIVYTVAGTAGNTSRSDGLAAYAGLNAPTDVAWLGDSTFAVADTGNNRIRIVQPYKAPAGIKKDGTVHLVLNADILKTDAAPIVSKGVTYVPVRVIGDNLGYKVDAPSAGSATLTAGDRAYKLTAGQATAVYREGREPEKTVSLGAAAFIRNNRMYVPVRFFAEQIDLDVKWLNDTKTVVLRTKLK